MDEQTNETQAIASHVPADHLADELDVVTRWWTHVVPSRGIPTPEEMDVLGICLRGLRSRAYDLALTLRNGATP